MISSTCITAIWAAIPTHTSRAVSVLHNSRCSKKPSVFACLSTCVRKINSASWWSGPRACPSKIRTKSTTVWKEKSTFLVRAANAPVRAANTPYGELHTSTNSRTSDHERGEHTTRRIWSGRGPGQSRMNLRRSKALRWSVRLSIVDISFCSGPDSADIVKTSLLACS